MFVPTVENPAEEFAVLGGRDGEIGNLARCWVALDAGDELKVPDIVFEEEVEQLIRVVDVFIVQQGKGVEFDVVFFAVFDGFHYLVEGAAAGVVFAVVIVEFFRAVNADADEEFIFVEKSAPLVVEQDSVGLEGVGDLLPAVAVFFLQVDYLFVKVEAHQCGLTPLPGEAGGGEC